MTLVISLSCPDGSTLSSICERVMRGENEENEENEEEKDEENEDEENEDEEEEYEEEEEVEEDEEEEENEETKGIKMRSDRGLPRSLITLLPQFNDRDPVCASRNLFHPAWRGMRASGGGGK